MTMKPNLMRIVPAWALILFLTGSGALGAVPKPRTDINPGLLYWQAFSVFPKQDEALSRALYVDGWPPGKLGQSEIEMARRFDPSFNLIRRAARMQVPCDWGFDLADGPNMVIPNLVQLRRAIYAAQLRARTALDDGRQSDAREDLLATLTMVRRVAIDGTLVQVMIATAAESSLLSFVADIFHRFETQTLRQLATGITNAPARVTVAQAIRTERIAFFEWFVEQLKMRRKNSQTETEALEQCHALIEKMWGLDQDQWDRILKNSGGTSIGLVGYAKQLSPVYDEMEKVTTAPYQQVEQRISDFEKLVENHPNIVVSMMVPNLGKARKMELQLMIRLAMFNAAVAYRSDGLDGLNFMRSLCAVSLGTLKSSREYWPCSESG